MNGRHGVWDLLGEHWQLARDLRSLQISFDLSLCSGVLECYEVCPVNCWAPDEDRGLVIFHHPERCIACGACVLQCPQQAIQLTRLRT